MCGRFSLTVSEDLLKDHFRLKIGLYMRPRYNIAPSNLIPVIRSFGNLEFLHWGFHPSWQGFEPTHTIINARSETLAEKPFFKQAFKSRRCLIIADGYYEWKQVREQKQPFYIRRRDKGVFAFAGVWENETTAIITRGAEGSISRVHLRMPLIISPESYRDWLDPTTGLETKIMPLLEAPLQGDWEIYPVSSKMNAPQFDTPLCIQAL